MLQRWHHWVAGLLVASPNSSSRKRIRPRLSFFHDWAASDALELTRVDLVALFSDLLPSCRCLWLQASFWSFSLTSLLLGHLNIHARVATAIAWLGMKKNEILAYPLCRHQQKRFSELSRCSSSLGAPPLHGIDATWRKPEPATFQDASFASFPPFFSEQTKLQTSYL